VHEKARTGLARALSRMGYCSRSQAAALVRAGRVTLNQRLTHDPEKPVRMGLDHIAVDDAPVEERPKIYLMMNKPRGVVTTASDEKGRATVYDLLKPGAPWVGPVGRLDKASEGLLLFTSDSKWAAKIADPESHLEKRYHVQVNCVAGDDLVTRIAAGVTVGGEHLRVKAARVVRVGNKNSWLEISIDEGKNRHIRRLLEALGLQVLRLVRVSIGPLELGNLKKGEARPLTDGEKRLVDHALGGSSGSLSQKHDGRAPKKVG
jgi:23S rRNA pseudouridine2605 synthase